MLQTCMTSSVFRNQSSHTREAYICKHCLHQSRKSRVHLYIQSELDFLVGVAVDLLRANTNNELTLIGQFLAFLWDISILHPSLQAYTFSCSIFKELFKIPHFVIEVLGYNTTSFIFDFCIY